MHILTARLHNRLSFPEKIKVEIEKYPRRKKIVHVGCGTGRYTPYLAAVADEVVGIDRDREKIEIARGLYPQLKFLPADPAQTGFSDRQFDTAFLIMYLHEAYSDELIKETCRIAGEVVVIDYSRILYGLRGKIIRLVEKDNYERFAGINLVVKFAGFGFSLRESRSIQPNFYIYFFVRSGADKKTKKLFLI
ncbi:MAG: class I SAM-dependent methyltransferase [Peptococcaceae bacterium]|nr:class I SAM-dependent methyltransferase [Peptococcaceae bacterium]